MAKAFPADDPVARWVMNLSIALNDLRAVATYATREEQPEHERIYFVRIFASHLREVAKLVTLDYDNREDIREYVDGLPEVVQAARRAAANALNAPLPSLPGSQLWKEMKRLRDDTFHYASDNPSQRRLQAAMDTVAEADGVYALSDDGWLRADYADLVVVNRMHPYGEDDDDLTVTMELHTAITEFSGLVANFIHLVEATYLNTLPDGRVVRQA